MQETISKKRIKGVFLVFGFCALTIVGRAFYIQVVNKDNLENYFKGQVVRESIIYPKRANIVDRSGEPLAINIQTYSIFVYPLEVKGKSKYQKIAEILEYEDLMKVMNKVGDRIKFTWIERKVELSEDQVMALKKIDGVYLEKNVKRFYPNDSLLSQVLGYVGVDNKGLSGVELVFDHDLRGRAKKIKYVRDAKGRLIKYIGGSVSEQQKPLELSIDKDIQAFAEKSLKEGIEKFNAQGGGIGVMDVQTGEILAMANYPDFNPNNIKRGDVANMKIPFVSDPFEPGSVLKTFTVASALENKKASKQTNYFCEKGEFIVNGHKINEAESKKKYEWLSVQEILRYSSNIGTTKIAFDLGLPLLKKSLEEVGFGSKTEIELPGESRGIFNYDKNSAKIRLSNLSFGQGVATTGIQILSAYAALANDGVLVPPTILKGDHQVVKRKRVFSKETVNQIEEILADSVSRGTGSGARVKFFQIAGKTSTAQRPSEKGGYDGYIPGFVGYPVNIDRRFVIYVYIDSPKGEVYYGNAVAAPIFQKVAQYILYNDRDHFRYALKKLDSDSKIVDKIKLVNSAGKRKFKPGSFPNLIGLDKKSVLKIIEKYDLAVDLIGNGLVSYQFPEAGTDLKSVKNIVIRLSPPNYE